MKKVFASDMDGAGGLGAPSLDEVAIAWERFRLPNGLTVIVHEDRKAPLVTVNIWYRVGAKDEPAGQSGFAHLFEHLMFGGSKHVQGSYINKMLEVGATELNGTTNHDRTNYFQTVPTHALDYALFAESDRMGHFYDTISQETLELQRGVVQNEKRQTEGQPYGLIGERVAHACYPVGHPYAHTVLGSMRDIERATLDDVRRWFKTYYGPSNAVLVLAGDIDVATAREKVARYFGDIPAGPPLPRPLSWVARREGQRREVLEDRVPNARLIMVWNVPEAGSPDALALALAGEVLGGGFSSRLHRRLVQELKLAVHVFAGLSSRLISGQFHVSATLRQGGNVDEVERVIAEELARFLAEGPSAAELARIRIGRHADLIRGLGSSQAVADLLAMNEVYFGDPDAYRRQIDQEGRLTAAQVRASAQQWLADGAYVLQVLPFAALQTGLPAGVDRSRPPDLPAPQGISFPPLQQARLSNGVRVLLAERHELPLLQCKLLLPGGSAWEAPACMGLAQLMTQLMSCGAGERDALAFSEAAQDQGAILGAGCGLDFTGLRLSALKSRLAASLDLFADMVLRPRFDETELQRVRTAQLESISQQQAQPAAALSRVLPGLMYGAAHVYARVPSGLASTVAAISREQVLDFHRRMIDPQGAVLMLAGDTTLAEILPQLEARFGAWRSSGARPAVEPAAAMPVAPGVYLVDRPGAAQTSITAALLAPGFDAGSEPALSAVNHILGGSFSSRINMNLREDKHWTYGVGSGFGAARRQRIFSISTAVQADKTADSLREIQRELADLLADRPVRPDELHAMQQSTILALPAKVQTLDGLMGAMEMICCHGLAPDYWSGQAERVRALDVPQVQASASALIAAARPVWLVAGDRALIEADIRQLQWGEPIIIQADGEHIYGAAGG
jgi:zinc protease